MIPKIIHYCWFGGNEKSDFILRCMESWKINLPDYKIVEWNETNFSIDSNIFTREAYSKKKWAFVSDYVRAYALYNFGGIYLDTDVEIKHNLDKFLHHGAFSGFEKKGYPFTALWGAKKNHIWPRLVVEQYDKLMSFELITNTVIVSQLLVDEFKVIPDENRKQELQHDIVIYPSSFFCLNLEPNYATHHFNGSWLETKPQIKENLHNEYYRSKYFLTIDANSILEDLYNSGSVTLKEMFYFAIKILSMKLEKKIAKLKRNTFLTKNNKLTLF